MQCDSVSDSEVVVGPAGDHAQTPSSQASEEPGDSSFKGSEQPVEPPAYIHSKVWKAGDEIPSLVQNAVLAGCQTEETSEIRSGALAYLAQPDLNNCKVPPINPSKMKVLEEALNKDEQLDQSALTEDEKKMMDDYIQANIVDDQVGRHKKKPQTVKRYAIRLFTSTTNGLLPYLKRKGISWRFSDIAEKKVLNTNH